MQINSVTPNASAYGGLQLRVRCGAICLIALSVTLSTGKRARVNNSRHIPVHAIANRPKGGTTNCAFHFSVSHFPAALSADSNGDGKIDAQFTVRPRAAQSSWDETRDMWDETDWRRDYRSAFKLIYSEVCAIALGNCG
jgi:hypothetical protein